MLSFMGMRIANAPCSWGVLEFGSDAGTPPAAQVLDEIAATGYAGTELGDWGFLGTVPARIKADLEARRLALAGAFVAVPLSDVTAHADGMHTAVATARLLVESGADRPILVLSDATAAVPARTAKAGRITPADGLGPREWDAVAQGAERIARAVLDATGVRTAFHHHCATYVETAGEIDSLMRLTSPELVGLCLDTGHAAYGGADPVAVLTRHASRLRHVHLKDCSAEIAASARAEGWDYVTAIRRGLFCELGRGQVDFDAVLAALRAIPYDGWIVVEQDVLPAMGTPAESAARNRRFLEQLGI